MSHTTSAITAEMWHKKNWSSQDFGPVNHYCGYFIHVKYIKDWQSERKIPPTDGIN